MSAKHKLNSAHVTGCALIAGLIGAIAGSWIVFAIVFAGLIALDLHAGNIRR